MPFRHFCIIQFVNFVIYIIVIYVLCTGEPIGSQPPERGGRAQGVRPEARTNNPSSHQSFGQLSVEPQDSCGRGLAYSYQC